MDSKNASAIQRKSRTGTTIRIPRIMIAAPSSGSGKTLMTCAVLRLLQRRGIKAAAFKCGPDFIDPMFHRRVLGTPSRNLDLYLAGEEGVRRAFLAGCREADILTRDSFGSLSGAKMTPMEADPSFSKGIAVIEGVMGYYDGTGKSGMDGSSYRLACETGTPVILAADVRGMSRSAAALFKGFAEYGEQNRIRGALLNRVSPSMAGLMAGWIDEDAGIPVLGSLPEDSGLRIGSRHLGLVEPGEIPDLMAKIERAADLLEKTLDWEKLLEIAESAPPLEIPADQERDSAQESRKVTIAVAEDEAFSFYYEDNLELLQELGAEIVRFSPVHDRELPDADGLLLGGGYPELRAGELSRNLSMRSALRCAAESGMPILAECGGFQYLLEELVDTDGKVHRMAGVLQGRSTMTKKLVRFGYVEVSGEGLYFDRAGAVRGHEFHYSDSTNNGRACKAVKPNGRSWDCMVVQRRVAAGYPHLYYRSAPAFAEAFVGACRKYREERNG